MVIGLYTGENMYVFFRKYVRVFPKKRTCFSILFPEELS